MFFGIAINAANGIATQVNGVLMQFSSSITTAIRPQLVKSAGEGDKDRMLSLTYIACKFPFILTGRQVAEFDNYRKRTIKDPE